MSQHWDHMYVPHVWLFLKRGFQGSNSAPCAYQMSILSTRPSPQPKSQSMCIPKTYTGRGHWHPYVCLRQAGQPQNCPEGLTKEAEMQRTRRYTALSLSSLLSFPVEPLRHKVAMAAMPCPTLTGSLTDLQAPSLASSGSFNPVFQLLCRLCS